MATAHMAISLFEHQKKAVEDLKTGSILVGGVGSGKSLTALAYYILKECGGTLDGGEMKRSKDLYIITTARKRDTLEWDGECLNFCLSKNIEENPYGVNVVIDSWNNIQKYTSVKNSFFIFDEQRVVGSGAWVKSFLKICKSNTWLLLSATPGDTWMDYIPVFLANGWYKNRTEFIREHVVFKFGSKYPKIDRYVNIGKLVRLRNAITVSMHYQKKTIAHEETVPVAFDKELYNTVLVSRWDVYENKPIKNISKLCYLMRRVVNSDPRRIDTVALLLEKHPRSIVFYNFDYERDLLLGLGAKLEIPTAEWSGHKHESIPETSRWLYLVQYTAGAEGWNCVTTNVTIFYSQNYSYKATIQAAGRIDRLNTPYTDLYYYYLCSNSAIDLAIKKAFNNKRDFNENQFIDL